MNHKKYLQSFFLMRVTSRPKLIRVLSMHRVPNSIYAVDLYRATHISAGNQTPCFIQCQVKLVRNTHFVFRIKPVIVIYHYPKSWFYQIYIFNIVIKDKNSQWSLFFIITIFTCGDKKAMQFFKIRLPFAIAIALIMDPACLLLPLV